MSKPYSQKISLQMEHAVAAALLADGETFYPQIETIVSAADFESSHARTVFQVTGKLLKENKHTDPYIILDAAQQAGLPLDYQFCEEALKITPTPENTVEYAAAIHNQALARSEDDIGMRLLNGELDGQGAIAELQELARQKSSTLQSPQAAANSMMEFINSNAMGSRKPFIPTGFYTLDDILSGGLVSGGLITLAARPGTGKTTAGICIAENVASKGFPVLYVSLEMTTAQIWTCRLANYGGLNRSEIYTGNYTGTREEIEQKMKRVVNAVEDLYSTPFFVRDVPSSVEDIESAARSIPDIGLIVVDHIGLLRPPAGSGKGRYEVMTEIAHRLKQLALSLQIPILALCQLNRMSLERKERRPTMADLRDSGAIEEDSDAVILLFRDDSVTNTGEAQKIRLIVDKNRHGMTGFVDMKFIGSMSRIAV